MRRRQGTSSECSEIIRQNLIIWIIPAKESCFHCDSPLEGDAVTNVGSDAFPIHFPTKFQTTSNTMAPPAMNFQEPAPAVDSYPAKLANLPHGAAIPANGKATDAATIEDMAGKWSTFKFAHIRESQVRSPPTACLPVGVRDIC